MSNYGLVTRAFPADYWTAHGDEILDTANDLHDEQWSARESRSLLAHGLRTRSLAATGGSLRQMWIQCAAFAVTWWILQGTATNTADLLGLLPRNFELVNPLWSVLAGAVTLALTLHSTRWMALVPPFLVGLSLAHDWPRQGVSSFVIISALAVVVAWKGDGRPALGPRIALALAVLHIAGLSIGIFAMGLLPLLLLPLGLLTMWLEPRVLGVAAVEVLLISGAIAVSVDSMPGGELAVAVGVVSAALLLSTTLASLGNRRLERMT